MNRKKLVRVVIIVIVVIIVLIAIENLIRKTRTVIVEKEKISEETRKEEIYKQTAEYKEEVMLDGIVQKFAVLLNEKNTDALYELIDSAYKDYKYQNNKEKFIEDMSKYIFENAKLSIQTYEKVRGRYVCRVLSYSNGVYSSFPIIITPDEDGTEFTLIFDTTISSIEKTNKKGSFNDRSLTCNILYTVAYAKTRIYALEYTNKGTKDINYTYDSITLDDTDGNMFSCETEIKSISLKPGEKIRQDITFKDNEINKYIKKNLKIIFSGAKGEKSEMNLQFMETGITD